MFLELYFPHRFFTSNYWSKVGEDAAPSTGNHNLLPLLGVG